MEPIKAGGLVIVLLITLSLYRAHKDNTTFNLFDLLMHQGRVDKLACVFIGSWALHSWIMIDLQLAGKMSEGYLTLYAATWIAPVMAKMFAKAPESTTTTTLTKTEVVA